LTQGRVATFRELKRNQRTVPWQAEIERTKPIAMWDHWSRGPRKTTLTVRDKVSAVRGWTKDFVPYDQVAKASGARAVAIRPDFDDCDEHVEYATDKRHIRACRLPRACRLREDMITGAAQMDGAILVVSAADGPIRRR